MADDPIPADLRAFIQRHIDSVAQLEALLLLRSTSGTNWDVATVAKRLYAAEPETADVLTQLCEDGFLACMDGAYRYAGATDLDELVARLASAYARHLIAVTNMIHAKPRRIRQFADAFRFRKDR